MAVQPGRISLFFQGVQCTLSVHTHMHRNTHPPDTASKSHHPPPPLPPPLAQRTRGAWRRQLARLAGEPALSASLCPLPTAGHPARTPAWWAARGSRGGAGRPARPTSRGRRPRRSRAGVRAAGVCCAGSPGSVGARSRPCAPTTVVKQFFPRTTRPPFLCYHHLRSPV